MALGSFAVIDLFDEIPHFAQQRGKCPPLGDGLSCIAAML
jgi:hypothetical protein